MFCQIPGVLVAIALLGFLDLIIRMYCFFSDMYHFETEISLLCKVGDKWIFVCIVGSFMYTSLLYGPLYLLGPSSVSEDRVMVAFFCFLLEFFRTSPQYEEQKSNCAWWL